MAKTLPYPKIGDRVLVVQKKDYPTGILTEGIVRDILTSKQNHPRGTKVRLADGTIGRVQAFADRPELGQLEQKEHNQSHEDITQVAATPEYFSDPDALV